MFGRVSINQEQPKFGPLKMAQNIHGRQPFPKNMELSDEKLGIITFNST